jgi:hypothetical protein
LRFAAESLSIEQGEGAHRIHGSPSRAAACETFVHSISRVPLDLIPFL